MMHWLMSELIIINPLKEAYTYYLITRGVEKFDFTLDLFGQLGKVAL